MGCSSSTAVQYAEITDLCQCPGVLFHEEIQVLNNASRNVASWLPELEPVKAAVIISHGLNEHILRYYGIATDLAKHGFAVYGIDHVSHGKSTGKRGVIPDCTVMYRDFIAFGTSIKEKHPAVPLFMLAHSMGTLVGMMSINSIPQLKAAVLSGPAVIAGPGSSSPFGMRCLYPLSQTSFAICLTSVTSTVDPRGAAAPLVLEEITSDPDELERIRKDPRLAPPIVTNKSAYEVVKLINATKAEIPNIKLPFVCVHGANDTIALPASSQYVYDHAGTDPAHKSVHLIADSKHEPFHESPAIRTAAIDFVVNYFEDQYQVAVAATTTAATTAGPEVGQTGAEESKADGTEQAVITAELPGASAGAVVTREPLEVEM